jgi:ABC-type branched-subunit amino acid transport system substrate-binding protein
MFATRCAAVVAALLLAGCGAGAPSAPETTSPIKVGHLNWHAGDWAPIGAAFRAVTDFTVDIINEDPPLGRTLEVIDKDIVSAGEAAIAKKLVEQDGVDVLFNVAYDYPSYRDWMLDQVETSRLPAMLSALSGAIPPQYGGTVEEPLMRGVPQDTADASAAALHASNLGARTIAILANEYNGLGKEQARVAATKLGLEVVLTLDLAAPASSYGAEIREVAAANPDVVLVLSNGTEGGTFVKDAAEAGHSWTIIGGSIWAVTGFSETATMEAIARHEAVLFAGTTHAEGPAWDYYQPRYDAYAATPAGKALEDQPVDGLSINFYDTLTLTALAIEQAGTTATDKWLPAMRAVAMAPGTKCSSYAECVTLIRAGTDVDYSGVTGEMDYTDTGVVSATWGVYRWTGLEETGRVTVLDTAKVSELEKAGLEAGVGR